MTSFTFLNKQPNGQWLKSITFKLPIIDEDLNISLDNDEQVDIIDKDGKDISLQNTNIAFRDVTFSYDKVPVLR
ncbi:MAG: hypothetical protein EGR36_03825, partial [Eubacterium ventriosum]|nr:hypothetical protein [Eubacterium ventriosum]